MIKQALWFIGERAEAFASLMLTKSNEVTVRAHAGTDMGIDLLIEVLKNGKSRKRFFGVQVVGYIDLPDMQRADERVLSHLARDQSEADLPICVFVIGVRKPEGIYRWIVEPVIGDGRALLDRDTEAGWQTLDEEAVCRIIRQVNAWYDARNGGSTPKERGRHSNTKS